MARVDDILTSAKALEHIPHLSVDAYVSKKQIMLERVDKAILSHPHLSDFLGDNVFELLSVNHRNHVHFMAEVFAQNDFELLAQAIPWVYRAYHNQGVSHDYFITELNAWIDAISEYIDADLQKPLINVYQWMLSHHQTSIEISRQEDGASEDAKNHLEPVYKEFSSALSSSDHQQCLGVCQQALKLGIELPDVFEHIIYPAMVDVGDQWEKGEISVAEEHRATAIVNRIISRLYYETHFPKSTVGCAVVSAAPSEKHEMGAWMLAACLELENWQVIFLGSDLPAQEVISTTLKTQPDLLALSVAMPFSMDSARKVIEGVKSDSKGKDIKVIAGGQVFNRFPQLVKNIDADEVFSNCWQAVEWAKTINRHPNGVV